MHVTYTYRSPAAAMAGHGPAPPLAPPTSTSRIAVISLVVAVLSLVVAVLALMTTLFSTWNTLRRYETEATIAKSTSEAAERERQRQIEFDCAQIALDLRSRIAGEADRTNVLVDLGRVMTRCDAAGQSLKQIVLRDVRNIASGAGGEVARAARRAERTLLQPRLSHVAHNRADPAEGAGDRVNVVPYRGGPVPTGTGLLNFRRHVDNPSNNELRKAVGEGIVGVGLLAFPGLVDIAAREAGLDTSPFQAVF